MKHFLFFIVLLTMSFTVFAQETEVPPLADEKKVEVEQDDKKKAEDKGDEKAEDKGDEKAEDKGDEKAEDKGDEKADDGNNAPERTVQTGQNYLQYLPVNTLFTLSLHNMAKVKEDFSNHSLSRFWNDEEVRAFVQRPLERLYQELDKLQQQTGVAWRDYLKYLNIAQGQVLFAVTDFKVVEGSPAPEVHILMLIDAGTEVEKIKELLDRFWQQGENLGLIKHEEDFMGETIVYIKPDLEKMQDQEIAAGLQMANPCYCIKDGLFLVGINDASIKGFVSKLSGTSEAPGLLENEVYSQTMTRCRIENSDSSSFVNIQGILDLVKQNLREDEGEQFNKVMNILGLSELRGMGYEGHLFDQRLTAKGFVSMPGERKGLMNLFQQRGEGALQPVMTPDSVSAYMATDFSARALWDMAMEFMQMVPEAGVMDQMRAMEEQLGFTFAGDFLPTLGNEIRIHQDYTMPLGLESERTTLTFSLSDAEKFETCLEKIFEIMMPQAKFSKIEYMGAHLRSVEGFPGNPEDAPAFAIHNGQLIFSNKRSGVEHCIRLSLKDQGHLRSSEEFNKAISHLPTVRNSLYYRDFPKEMEYMVAVMKIAADMVPAEELDQWVDMQLWPKAQVFTKYFNYHEIGSMRVEEDGISLVMRLKQKDE